MDLLRIMTAGSVDDGKSTLIGRLFLEYGQIHDDNLESIAHNGLNLAYFTDGLKEEREKGITIDVAYKYLETPTRKFIIADCPGHKEFTRNMVTGATTSDLVLILVDAERGITEQTWRHTAIVSWLGKNAVYLLNKMDIVGYQESVYHQFSKKLTQFPIIPISALHGENVLNSSEKMLWYEGECLNKYIHDYRPKFDQDSQIIFPIQNAIQNDALGTLEKGTLFTGQRLKNFQGVELRIQKMFKGLEETREGNVGDPFRLCLSHPVSRGEILVSLDAATTTQDSWVVEWCQLALGKSELILRYKTSEFKVKEIIAEEVFELETGKWIRFTGETSPDNIYRGTILLNRPLTFIGREAALFDLCSGNTVGALLLKPSEPWLSHTLLQPACEKYISSRFNSRPWFPGNFRLPQIVDTGEILHVVLFGDYLEEIQKFQHWPRKEKYRLWVLCHSVRNVLINLLGFNENQIGVFDRQDLFSVPSKVRKIPKKDSEFNLVYSGRFVMNKNFNIFLRVASLLQTEFGFKNMKVNAFGFYPYLEKASAFHFLTLKLKWFHPPQFYSTSGPSEWMGKCHGENVLMTLSRHRKEDFGVSVAQAQSEGWPCIVSDWGGHRDLRQTNVLKVPVDLIPISSHITENFDVRKIAEFISENWERESEGLEMETLFPEDITASQIGEVLSKSPLKEDYLKAYDRIFGAS